LAALAGYLQQQIYSRNPIADFVAAERLKPIRHRHRHCRLYEVNVHYKERLEQGGWSSRG
jgi:hypothetical protein